MLDRVPEEQGRMSMHVVPGLSAVGNVTSEQGRRFTDVDEANGKEINSDGANFLFFPRTRYGEIERVWLLATAAGLPVLFGLCFAPWVQRGNKVWGRCSVG